jgi:hypothetical protein
VDLLQEIAGIEQITWRTRLKPFCNRAVPDLALIAMGEFHTGLHATCTIDRFNRDGGRIELHRPFFSRFSAQRIVIGNCGDPGVAGSAVQSTAGNNFFHDQFILKFVSTVTFPFIIDQTGSLSPTVPLKRNLLLINRIEAVSNSFLSVILLGFYHRSKSTNIIYPKPTRLLFLLIVSPYISFGESRQMLVGVLLKINS